MVRVGVIGLGMMGLTHLDAYAKHDGVKIAAICDSDPDRLSGKAHAAGNIEGQAQSTISELTDVQRLSDAFKVIGNPDIDLVDVCLPTDLHVKFGCEVLKAGQHLVMEKPLARTSADAKQLADAARDAKGSAFVGHCMRFWPGWTWLKQAIDDGRFGKVYSATFRRVVNHPGGPFYTNGDRCGGAALDLHIHDTDFVQFCFGMPKAVRSFGYSKITNQPDHIITNYAYDEIPLVVAEGSWAMADSFIFNMSYTVNFETATAVFDSASAQPLTLYENGKEPQTVEVQDIMGYNLEIDYFVECIEKQQRPTIVTMDDAMRTVQIVEAEIESVQTGATVNL